MVERARLLGAAFRVAHLISAARPGVLPATHFRSQARKLMLVFEHRMVDLGRRPRRQPLQATGAAGRTFRFDRQAVRMIRKSGSTFPRRSCPKKPAIDYETKWPA